MVFACASGSAYPLQNSRIDKENHLVKVAAWFDNETSHVSPFIKLAALL
jgi:glyceraldehyde-3-phosphate dehydrogenase/erythrose-4-phosphate dehydrogenase